MPDSDRESIGLDEVRFVTACNDAFVPGLAILLASLRTHLEGFEAAEFIVIHHDRVSPVSAATRQRIVACFPNVRFEQADLTDYPDMGHHDGHSADVLYLTFEAFRPTDARRVVFMDVDMLVVRDFSEALELDHGFIACSTGGEPVVYRGPERHTGTINTGFFILGPEHLDGSTLRALFARLEQNLGGRVADDALDVIRDQAIINATVPIRRIHVLPNTYNFRAFRHLAHLVDVADELRILHFAGYWHLPKPWVPDAPLGSLPYRIWAEAAMEAVDEMPELEALIPGFDRIRAGVRAARLETQTARGILRSLRTDVEEDLASERYRYGDTALNRVRALTPAWVARLAHMITGAGERAGDRPG